MKYNKQAIMSSLIIKKDELEFLRKNNNIRVRLDSIKLFFEEEEIAEKKFLGITYQKAKVFTSEYAVRQIKDFFKEVEKINRKDDLIPFSMEYDEKWKRKIIRNRMYNINITNKLEKINLLLHKLGHVSDHNVEISDEEMEEIFANTKF